MSHVPAQTVSGQGFDIVQGAGQPVEAGRPDFEPDLQTGRERARSDARHPVRSAGQQVDRRATTGSHRP